MKLHIDYYAGYEIPDEINYLLDIINQVCDFFFHENINFYVTNNVNIKLNTTNNIVFISGCENDSKLRDNNFILCFNNFYRENGDSRYVPFPLGNNKFINKNLYTHEVIPFEERKYDIFFAGFIHESRIPFKNAIEKINCSKYIHFTSANNLQKFDNELDPNQYLNILKDSKILLAPRGAHHATSYRYFESLYFQNIVIFEKNENEEIYLNKNLPNQYKINSWENLSSSFIEDIIKKYDSKENKNNYKNLFCKRAVVSSVIDKINLYVK